MKTADLNKIEKYVIYPTLGISRVGNSAAWFYAPEVPGQPADPRVPLQPDLDSQDTQYKDAEGAIKRQAARFRVYGLDKEGKVVSEMNTDSQEADLEVAVEWSVHLANRKAAWYDYVNPLDLDQMAEEQQNTKALALSVTHRNNSYGGVPFGLQPSRDQLVIDAGPVAITGKNARSAPLDQGQFMGEQVYLGELRTDEQGRLIVIGGLGKATNTRPYNPVHHFANNDGWYDDTSDGPVRAKIIIRNKGQEEIHEAEPAFVAVVPPNYGPGLYGITTMYDIVTDVYAHKSEGGVVPRTIPSFEEDIWPIFKSLCQSQWVSEGIYTLFGQGSPSNFTDPKVYRQLISNNKEDQPFKKALFSWFRNPDTHTFEPTQIPANYGDALRDFSGQPNENLWITRTQYAHLKQWSEGHFTPPQQHLLETPFPLKKQANPDPLAEHELADQPHLLTKAALQECLGGPFRPGIEISWPLRVSQMWKPAQVGEVAPFRLNVVDRHQEDNPEFVSDDYGPVLTPKQAMAPQGPVHYNGPGTLTRWMGVPWQADASSCLGGLDASNYLPLPTLWAPRAPQDVLSMESFDQLESASLGKFQKEKHFNYRQFWLRDLDNTETMNRINDMAAEWSDLGIVAAKELSNEGLSPEVPELIWVEQQRSKAYTNWDPSLLQLKVAEGKLTANEAIEKEKAERAEYREGIEDKEHPRRPRKIPGRLQH